MSEFVSQNILPDLWEDILQRHWTYLETEESMLKLDERKKLEACLKQFLCIVPHDRKFFLPETTYVLKKSIEEMDGFSAYNAMIGFESISQYANNLFTKPWRKEYKVIKMYSGFYQHEIKSKLLHAEKLFEAMGYRQFNQLLVLDGPICPDQVTNVSRDAMAAYVECQIMKQILSGLTSLQLSCNWIDIFKFRETHICGTSQAIKMMAQVIQDKMYRNEKLNQENLYGTKQHQQGVTGFQQQNIYANCNSALCQFQSQPPLNQPKPLQPINSCQIHNNAQQQQQQQQGPPLPPPSVMHKYPQQHPCSIHNKPVPVPPPIYNGSQLSYPNYPHMSHSKSLEYYNEANNSNVAPLRHSFDHYEPSYDCVDTGCNNYNSYNHHPYNVSGNRYPLPYNISNQLLYGQQNYHQQPSGPPIPPPPATVNYNQNGYGINKHDVSVYGFQPSQHFNNVPNSNAPNRPVKSLSHDSSCNMHNNHGDEYLSSQNHRRSIPQSGVPSIPNDQLIHLSNQMRDAMYIDTTDDTDGNYIYSKPKQTHTNLAKKISSDLQKNRMLIDNMDLCKLTKQNSSSGTCSTSSKSSKSVSNKNQDGVGSFESWNFVFQNLEKHGYSKDLGERGDLLMQGLNDSKSNDGVIKQLSYDDENLLSNYQSYNQSKKNRDSILTNSTTTTIQPTSISSSKQRASTTTTQETIRNNSNNRDSSSSRISQKQNKSKSIKNSVNNNVENYTEINGSNKHSIGSTITTTTPTNTTSTNCKTSAREWSCRFCTFLNPDSKRICEMCSRSKDFNLEGNKSSATCV